jgi:hypothetical protein
VKQEIKNGLFRTSAVTMILGAITSLFVFRAVAFAKEVTLTLQDAPLTIAKGNSVTKKINGIPAGTPGSISLQIKWHAMTLVPNTFEKLKIEILHGSNVVLTKQCYSIHADKEPKCYLFPLTSNDEVEFKRSGDWKIRATNNSNNDVNGFNIKKEGTDLNPFVPGFVSTFEANCSVRYLGISGAPVNIAPRSTVERELFGMIFGAGEMHLKAKWHIGVITPNVFDQLKVEVIYDGTVLATDYGYSIHSNEANKLDLKLNSNGGDVFKWKLRITNDTGLQVNGFDIEKGNDSNPFVPSFRSTFKPSCN